VVVVVVVVVVVADEVLSVIIPWRVSSVINGSLQHREYPAAAPRCLQVHGLATYSTQILPSMLTVRPVSASTALLSVFCWLLSQKCILVAWGCLPRMHQCRLSTCVCCMGHCSTCQPALLKLLAELSRFVVDTLTPELQCLFPAGLVNRGRCCVCNALLFVVVTH
jgi:hypothetical protein